jgi:hypothetical protein
MMMKIERGISTSKPKGKGLLWYLRRNTNTRKYEKLIKTTRRRVKKTKRYKFIQSQKR